ncbi:MAG: hypothetical protein ACYTEL_26365 [Planctomycetota bacterium]
MNARGRVLAAALVLSVVIPASSPGQIITIDVNATITYIYIYKPSGTPRRTA